jgi:hypothetical protein
MRTYALIATYLVAVIAANLLVAAYGPAVSILCAFAFIGLDLTARDHLHQAWQGRNLWPRMALLIVAGSVLSWALNRNAGTIALASCAAFAAAGAADTLVYHALRKRPWFERINGSNLVSAGVDSLVFPWLAFGGWLPLIVLGQFAAKVAGGALWAALLRGRQRRAVEAL